MYCYRKCVSDATIAAIDTPRPIDVKSIFIFLVGATTTLDFSLVGRVMVSEMLMIIGLPFLTKGIFYSFKNSMFRWVLIAAVIALFATSISDLVVNSVSPLDCARGIARILFFLIPLFFWIGIFSDDFRLFRCYLWGLLPAGIIGYFRVSEYDFLNVQARVGYEFWLYKVSPLLLTGTCLCSLCLYRRSRIAAALPFLLVGIVLALKSSRYQAASYLTVSVVVLTLGLSSQFLKKINNVKSLALITLVLFCFSGIVYMVYIKAAPNGWLGENQQEKFKIQSESRFGVTPWGLLLTGRADSFAALHAALEKPIWGWGSWSVPREKIVDFYDYLGIEIPHYHREVVLVAGGDPGHSVIMGTWASSGIFAVLIWLIVLGLVVRLFFDAIRIDNAYTPYFLLITLGAVFTVFFNPLGLGARNSLALIVAAEVALQIRSHQAIFRRESLLLRNHGYPIPVSTRRTSNNML